MLQLLIKIILNYTKNFVVVQELLLTEAQEFYEIYNLNVVSIPTNKQMIRKDLMIKFIELKKKKISNSKINK